jgi:PAS domain S-box-containing protein
MHIEKGYPNRIYMHHKSGVAGGRQKNLGYSALIVALSIVLALASIIIYAITRSSVHNLHFTFFAFLSFLPLGVNVWLIWRIMRLRAQSEEAVWFVLYLCALSIACLGEGLQRMSLGMDGALFWYHLNSIGFAIMPLAYYLFALSYVKPLRSQSALLLPALFTSAGLMIFFFSSTDLFFSYHAEKELWGFNAPTTSAFPILLIWIEAPLIAALVTFIRFRHTVSNELLKRQSLIYIWALLIPLVGGTITDGILPAFGLNSIVPTSLFLSTCTSVIAYIGLKRYRAFEVNPASFAEDVLNGMQEAVIVTNVRHAISFMNPQAERLLGNAYTELASKDIRERFGEQSWGVVSQELAGDSMLPASIEPDTLTIINDEGKRIPVRIYASRFDADTPDEAHIFIITDISDITASYRKLQESSERITGQNKQLQENEQTMRHLLQEAEDLQRQLRHEKENVEQVVDVRTAELREARDKLKKSDELKSEFIMLSSHNLRTPLTIMKNSVELLASTPNTLTDEERQLVDSLTDSTDRLGEFVEDLLAIATLEAGDELRLTPVSLDKVIAPLAGEVRGLAEAKGLAFEAPTVDKEIMVNANALRLRGAIRNILHNAVNFTSKGAIRFMISLRDNHVRLIVEDTGIGIKDEEIPQLFTKFHRATGTLVYDYAGEGLGLYLAKLVIDEHGGTISVESTYGQGSMFVIELPILKDDQAEAGTAKIRENNQATV